MHCRAVDKNKKAATRRQVEREREKETEREGGRETDINVESKNQISRKREINNEICALTCKSSLTFTACAQPSSQCVIYERRRITRLPHRPVITIGFRVFNAREARLREAFAIDRPTSWIRDGSRKCRHERRIATVIK